MEKRHIGIDIDDRLVRVAIISQDREALIAVGKREVTDPAEIPAALREMIGDTRIFSDRLAAALPAVEGFVRHLSFPFAEPRKIEAALRFELAAQIPITIDELTTDFQAPVAQADGENRVTAVAVRTAALESFLRVFDSSDIPLHILDLAPFALARGLKEHLGEAILVHLAARESTVCLVSDGRVLDYRLLPAVVDAQAPQTARLLLREATALQREGGRRDLPLMLIGAGATAPLLEELRQAGGRAQIPGIFVEGKAIEAEFLPAVALAQRASLSTKEREINFRRGPFALKNEWTALKRDLIAAAVVVVLALSAIAGASWLNYAHKANRAETLNQEIAKTFRATFPGAQPQVNPVQQMQSRIRELRERGRMVGAGQQRTPLAVLLEISRSTPESVILDVRDLSYTPESVRLEGVTSSFDAINQIARSLEQSALFSEAQIADAKISLDGSRVDFRLTLVYRGGMEQ
ncbi:MAG: PilN domain-containing protein [Desulfuromonadales bacterium]|nr:PilN domain-containing protein [Desulfuromonadales bacterium]